MWPPQEGLSAMEKVRSLMANLLASATRFGIWLGSYPPMHRWGCRAEQPPPGMACQPFIRPPLMAASCEMTVWFTLGTVSGITSGVTTAPLDRLTFGGIPPSGHRLRWALHQ